MRGVGVVLSHRLLSQLWKIYCDFLSQIYSILAKDAFLRCSLSVQQSGRPVFLHHVVVIFFNLPRYCLISIQFWRYSRNNEGLHEIWAQTARRERFIWWQNGLADNMTIFINFMRQLIIERQKPYQSKLMYKITNLFAINIGPAAAQS